MRKEEKIKLEKPAIYVVATPIGNIDDITLRAIKVLRSVDIVFCEGRKQGSRLLNHYDIEQGLIEVNEHTENELSQSLVYRIISENLSVALISDAGTPLFADPGKKLVSLAYQRGVRIIPVPGASSIMAALMSSGITSKSFIYYGFLSANRHTRENEIKRLPSDQDIIILEAPYRLKQVIGDLRKHLGSKRRAVIAWKLTYPDEEIIETDLQKLVEIAEHKGKGEFVIILRGRYKRWASN